MKSIFSFEGDSNPIVLDLPVILPIGFQVAFKGDVQYLSKATTVVNPAEGIRNAYMENQYEFRKKSVKAVPSSVVSEALITTSTKNLIERELEQ